MSPALSPSAFHFLRPEWLWLALPSALVVFLLLRRDDPVRPFRGLVAPHLLPHRSHSYYIKSGKRIAAPFDVDTGVTVSNGGLNAPMPDMAKYVAFLLGDPAREADYALVLKRSSLETGELIVKDVARVAPMTEPIDCRKGLPDASRMAWWKARSALVKPCRLLSH